ncbi:hypothetical protein DTO271G3_6996 [Paecilomyces variotii]|nr:hypothetical protein DTO271G3_6996 [Paecilomyces variotii]
MQFNILTLTVALAGAAAALPKIPAVSWNQTHAVTNVHAINLVNLTNSNTTRTAQKSTTLASQAGSSSSDNNVCTTLCSLQAQICSMALPTHDDYCWGTYLDCSRMCDPSLIH